MDTAMAKATVEGRQRSNEMFEFMVDRLNTLQRAEMFFNKFDYDQLDKMEGIIKRLKDDKHKEYLKEQQAEAKRLEVEQKIREMAAEHGIDIGELTSSKKATGVTKTGKTRRKPDPEKFAIKYKGDAKIYYWSGAGHPPKPFKDAIGRGYKKEDCLNPKTGNIFEITLKTPKAA